MRSCTTSNRLRSRQAHRHARRLVRKRHASCAGRMGRDRRAAVRLLPGWTADVCFRIAGQKSASHRCRYRRRDGRQYLPLRYLPAHSPSHPPGSRNCRETEGRAHSRRTHRFEPRVRAQEPIARRRAVATTLPKLESPEPRPESQKMSRRSFLRATALAGGGMMLGSLYRAGRKGAGGAVRPADARCCRRRSSRSRPMAS